MSAGKTIIRVTIDGMPPFRRADDGRPMTNHLEEVKVGVLALGDPRESMHVSHRIDIGATRLRLCEDGTWAKEKGSLHTSIRWDAQAPKCIGGLSHSWEGAQDLKRADGESIQYEDREDEGHCTTWDICRLCGCECQRALENGVFFDRFVSIDEPGNLCSKHVPRCDDCEIVLGWDADGRRVKDCPECVGGGKG